MMIAELSLMSLRAHERGKLAFKPGFNLIVGVNGVGKSTILDAIRVCMSRVLPFISNSRAKAFSFDVQDITVGYPFLDVVLSLNLDGRPLRFRRFQPREQVAKDNAANLKKLRREILDSDRPSERQRELLRTLVASQSNKDKDEFEPTQLLAGNATATAKGPANCIFFATSRSVISEVSTTKGRAVGGTAAAYTGALHARSWQILEFADWLRAQQVLADESPKARRHIEVLQRASTRFLPEYANVRPDPEGKVGLLIDKGKTTLSVNQLSDGERGTLAMVLDLARRLSQANPDLADPLKEGEAVVLIDELDLHLHPGWQRQIVHKLTEVFPRCQFIATTHSPQIIGEVKHDRIQIVTREMVYSPPQSFGVDSSRVLEEIMGTDGRTISVNELLKDISKLISSERFSDARHQLTILVNHVGESDPEVLRVTTLLDFLEGTD